MRVSYFKPRKPLDFSPHPYDIGNSFGSWHKYEDSHFLNKVYRIDLVQFEEYYEYHLTYALKINVCNEETFFVKVWEVVEDRIKNLRAKDPFSSYHGSYKFRIEKLQQFQKYLSSIDQWNARPSHIVIAEKEELIQKQKEEIERLTARLSELNEFEVLQKISIGDNALPTLVDLLKQMSQLRLPSGRSFLACDKKSPYSKMISKYFSHDGKDIPLETSRNYFVEKKGDIPIKGTTVRKEHRIFEIIPVKEVQK
ncbi:MAG: hypothetical protein P0Y49_07940 [Candidatus Pedobacter colombiensis]|uniref:Uncharacterized protein n=1 Tax=Candidatus Pedobacter colombiensis TaxID=3121371 RepID=A0AAJ5WAS6_9SPHI|nr:hypothetical protein [Pedobacter sp.]WEK21069.1 MAG: hypothetical protein P0Y49_07940 [Pedobacter sp.]